MSYKEKITLNKKGLKAIKYRRFCKSFKSKRIKCGRRKCWTNIKKIILAIKVDCDRICKEKKIIYKTLNDKLRGDM